MRRLSEYRAPGELEAGERAWSLVKAAYEEREPVTWPRRHVRPLAAGALVAAVVAAVVAAALSPPGRSVVRSLRKAVGIEKAQPALFSLPTQGQLLVTSGEGAWLVRPDGSRRLVGAYRDVAFSPHGLFIAGTRGNELVALDPKGKVRWTLARPTPRFPAWTGTRTDTRIAYISGGRVRVVAGDGTGDRALGRAALVAPAWRPGQRRVLAYSDGGSVIAVDANSGSKLLRVRTPRVPTKLAWSGDGKRLLVFSAGSMLVYDARGGLVLAERRSDGAFAPGTHRIAAIRSRGGQSEVAYARSGRPIFRGTGVFRQLAWSPDGHWLLVSWPTANQWVFVRTGERKIVATSRISEQFGGFPHIAGWCCAH